MRNQIRDSRVQRDRRAQELSGHVLAQPPGEHTHRGVQEVHQAHRSVDIQRLSARLELHRELRERHTPLPVRPPREVQRRAHRTGAHHRVLELPLQRARHRLQEAHRVGRRGRRDLVHRSHIRVHIRRRPIRLHQHNQAPMELHAQTRLQLHHANHLIHARHAH